MLGFSKKKKKNQESQNQIDPQLDEQIHTMPQRFYIEEKPKRRFGILSVLIVLGILVILGLGAFAFYLVAFPKNTGIEQSVDEQVNQNSNTNTQTNTDQVNTNIPVATTTELEIIEQPATSTQPVATSTEPEILENSFDADLDGLSLAEEKLYQGDSDNPDSDGDSFTDGTEVINGYDPSQANKSLVATGVFRRYNHPLYTINYPTAWRVQDQGGEKQEVLFISSTNEFIEVLVISNVNGLSLDDWYTKQFPERDINQAAVVEINNVKGLIAPDKKSYYLISKTKPQNIFLVTYNQANFSSPSFNNTFISMVKTFFSL